MLTEMDRSLLTNILSSYDKTIKNAKCLNNTVVPHKSRVKLQKYIDERCNTFSLLIDYFEHIPEFHQLNINDKSLLNRRNLVHLLSIHLLAKSTVNNIVHPWDKSEYLVYDYVYGTALLNKMDTFLKSSDILLHDSIIAKLLLIVLVFSTSLLTTFTQTNLSMINAYSNSIHIFQIQNIYTELLWNYLYDRLGEYQTVYMFSTFINRCLHMQNIQFEIDQNFSQRNDLCQVVYASQTLFDFK
ncbi:unnamed protein product [Didymodactylos carnosus]|uniref:Uncharacterized protein n=1 Tax=Didymodactylos carnosus TaxID=1234261 RepID=A0A815QS00_9BILA|nr:unnamed protein product [Didymodactylos carnosus]CAF1467034.1 unnamed protein product [Didymodactylos carnosus]CAF4083894.1 unnamed protein product [Didymodactylos carnosus]CAF4335904.1 unnamed protein product [Didymodactylos carnosus]